MKGAKVHYLTEPLDTFEKKYKAVRDTEKRWLSDDEVKKLPNLPATHPHHVEWKKRAWMLSKFSKYLTSTQPKTILEIGCGNGWLTAKIGAHCDSITGLDVGREELEQAARCFGSATTSFVCCSDLSLLPKEHYDIIYFAGSFHYFQPSTAFWTQLFRLLRPEGEIHILETQFYSSELVEKARKRSEDYFESMEVDVDYYHHICWDQLPKTHEVLFKPDFRNKLIRNRSPFPWVRIRK